MQVVVAAYSLAGAGGSETYLVTIADHLQRLGHDVRLHAAELGRSADVAARLGVRVGDREEDLPPAPDALLVQDAAVAYELAARYETTPQAFVAHSDVFDLQLPPQMPDVVAAVVVLHDRVERRVRALAQPGGEIVRLTQPIDVERFKPTRPLPRRARIAMALGNDVHGERLELLRRACDRAGLELRHVGIHGEGERPADEVLHDADVVFGKARVVLEAMACGRAAYVFDHNGGDGWVTADAYARLAADNFGGQTLPDPIDEDRIVADLASYDPGMGVVNRDLAVQHHSAAKHAADVAELLGRIAPNPRAAPLDAPLRELARMVRLYHRADAEAFASRARMEALAARTNVAEQRRAELERDVAEHKRGVAELKRGVAERDRRLEQLDATARDDSAATTARIAALEAKLSQARTAAAALEAESARLRRLLDEVTRSRRWRGVQALFAPADAVRRAARSRTPDPEPSTPADALPRATPSHVPAPKQSARATATEPSGPAHAPAPFVVGVARSGTTLLRLQLDTHPDLAIGPETGFGLVTRDLAGRDPSASELLAAIVALDTWHDLGLERDAAERALDGARPWSLGAGLRALYAVLAARDGKPRWGDKTPLHVTCMPQLGAALPEAHFIHLVRDGRDVAVSLRGLPFAPGDGSIAAIARAWREQILGARAAADGLPHYREVRYEQLVTEPERVLRELCEYVQLDFDAAMLRAHERAAMVMARLPERRPSAGAVVTRDERMARHALLVHPPDPARVGRWREQLTGDEVSRFEEHAGDLLAELGYA